LDLSDILFALILLAIFVALWRGHLVPRRSVESTARSLRAIRQRNHFTEHVADVMSDRPHVKRALRTLSGPGHHAHEWEDVHALDEHGSLVNRFCTVLGCEEEDESLKEAYAVGYGVAEVHEHGVWFKVSNGGFLRTFEDGRREFSFDPTDTKTRTIHSGDWNQQVGDHVREQRFRSHFGDDGGGPAYGSDHQTARVSVKQARRELKQGILRDEAFRDELREAVQSQNDRNQSLGRILQNLTAHSEQTAEMIQRIQPTVEGTEHPYVDQCRYCGRPSANVAEHQRHHHPEMF
jgi:hypothetical protein